MKCIRSFLTVLLAFPLVACATVGTVKFPGQSLASARLQSGTLETIKFRESFAANGCAKVEVVGTEVTGESIPPRYDGDQLTDGRWTERWTVDRCGKTVRYRVGYSINRTGAVVIDLSPPESGGGPE